MAKDRVIVGIDVGTSKITTAISTVKEDGMVNIIGVSNVPSKGLRKGQIVDIEESVTGVTEGLEGAERMAGVSVGSAYISVGGAHISCLNSRGVVAVSEPEKEITQDDVDRVIEAARAVSLPSSKEILHCIPRGFIVDGQEGIKDPIGMTGVRLEVDTHIITGASTAIRNLVKCISEVGVDVAGLIFSGLASGEATLSDTEKELGVILIDIGGGTTDLCLYVDGALSYSSVLPIGAKNITSDLAIGLRVSLESAEKIKLAISKPQHEVALPQAPKEKKEEDEVELSNLGIAEDVKKISKKTVVEGIIKPRLNEIFSMIVIEIKKSGFGGLTPAGVVITGGGAETVGIAEVCRRILQMPVRIGSPTQITGLIDEIQSPPFSTSVGLLHYAAKKQSSETKKSQMGGFPKSVGKVSVSGLGSKIIEFAKSFLP